jgi:hypothetical protein
VTLRNRVTPLSELVAEPARGLVYGNRGCLHDASGRIVRSHAVRRWIACRLEFRGWQRGPLLQPGKFTELFFLDDATALAAGHRPCALCRRADYVALTQMWDSRHSADRGADAIDLRLHAERLDGGSRRLHHARVDELPDGAMLLLGGEPWLVRGERLLRWTPAGYAGAQRRPGGMTSELLTPPSLVALLATGWRGVVPLLHPTAG